MPLQSPPWRRLALATAWLLAAALWPRPAVAAFASASVVNVGVASQEVHQGPGLPLARAQLSGGGPLLPWEDGQGSFIVGAQAGQARGDLHGFVQLGTVGRGVAAADTDASVLDTFTLLGTQPRLVQLRLAVQGAMSGTGQSASFSTSSGLSLGDASSQATVNWHASSFSANPMASVQVSHRQGQVEVISDSPANTVLWLSVQQLLPAGVPISVHAFLGVHLSVGQDSLGVADFSHTAQLWLGLPSGTAFTSGSGVFLTEAPLLVPEPGPSALLLAGLPWLAWRLRLRRPGRRRQALAGLRRKPRVNPARNGEVSQPVPVQPRQARFFASRFEAALGHVGVILVPAPPAGKHQILRPGEPRPQPPRLQRRHHHGPQRHGSHAGGGFGDVLFAVNVHPRFNRHHPGFKIDAAPAQGVLLPRPQAGGGGEQQLQPEILIAGRRQQRPHFILRRRRDLAGTLVASADDLDAVRRIDRHKVAGNGEFQHAVQGGQHLSHCWNRHPGVAQPVTQIADRTRRQLRQLHRRNAVFRVQNVVVDMPAIDGQVLARHPLPPLHAALAIVEVRFRDLPHRHLGGVSAKRAGAKLAFNLHPEGVRLPLGGELPALTVSCLVSEIDAPGAFRFALRCRPSAFADGRHGSRPHAGRSRDADAQQNPARHFSTLRHKNRSSGLQRGAERGHGAGMQHPPAFPFKVGDGFGGDGGGFRQLGLADAQHGAGGAALIGLHRLPLSSGERQHCRRVTDPLSCDRQAQAPPVDVTKD